MEHIVRQERKATTRLYWYILEGFIMISLRKSNEKFNKVELIVCTSANSLLAKNKGPYIHGYLYLENDFRYV